MMPFEPTTYSETAESIEQKFRRLEALWTAATGHLSSPTQIINNPAFQEILRMGKSVVPFMIEDLKERPRLWVWALPKLVGANPVDPSDAGNIAKMTVAWLRWAKDNRF